MAPPGTREYCHWYANTVYDYCAVLFLNPRTLKAKLEDHSVYLLLVVWFSNSTWSQHDAETIHRQRDNNIIERCSRRPPCTERNPRTVRGSCAFLYNDTSLFFLGFATWATSCVPILVEFHLQSLPFSRNSNAFVSRLPAMVRVELSTHFDLPILSSMPSSLP